MTDMLAKPMDRERILEQAAEWIVRAEEGDFSADDAARLAQWLESDPEHAAAYSELEALWCRIPQLPGASAKWPIAANDDADETTATSSGKWYWRFTGGLAACAVAVAVFLLVPFGAGPNEQQIETGIAQVSQMTLDDGSVATLGPKTQITIAFTNGERRLRLEHGEAFFDVAKDPERPFLVETGRTVVRVVGTRFNVKDGQNLLQIAVIEGTVRLLDRHPVRTDALLGTLHRGDVAQVVDTAGRSQVEISRVNDVDRFATLATGWREGWLIYEDTALTQIVEDLNRYYRPGVRLADPAIGETRITAAFKASNLTQFLDTLNGVFPVAVERTPDGSYLLARPGA